MSIFIPSEKYTKSDVTKTWKGIFINDIRTSKHLRLRASRTHQVLIASKLVVNKSKREADLLIKHLLPSSKKPLQPQRSELKLRGLPYKSIFKKRTIAKLLWDSKSNRRAHTNNIAIKRGTSDADFMQMTIMYISKWIRIQSLFDSKSRTDQGHQPKTPLLEVS